MKTADEYIHKLSIGNINHCREHSDRIAPVLKQLYANDKLLGYTVAVIKNMEDADFNLLEENEYINVTKGQFPFLFIVIQQKPHEPTIEIEFIDNNYAFLNKDADK